MSTWWWVLIGSAAVVLVSAVFIIKVALWPLIFLLVAGLVGFVAAYQVGIAKVKEFKRG